MSRCLLSWKAIIAKLGYVKEHLRVNGKGLSLCAVCLLRQARLGWLRGQALEEKKERKKSSSASSPSLFENLPKVYHKIVGMLVWFFNLSNEPFNVF